MRHSVTPRPHALRQHAIQTVANYSAHMLTVVGSERHSRLRRTVGPCVLDCPAPRNMKTARTCDILHYTLQLAIMS